MSFFKCTKFQLDQSIKTKKKTEHLATRISEMAESIFFKFCMYTHLPGGHFCSKFGYNRIRDHGDIYG